MSETTMNLKKRGAEKMAERLQYAPPGHLREQGRGPHPRRHARRHGRRTHREPRPGPAHHRRAAVTSATGEDAFDYRRVFVVAHGVEPDKIAASLQNGVLRVTLPKPAALKPRQIEVKAG